VLRSERVALPRDSNICCKDHKEHGLLWQCFQMVWLELNLADSYLDRSRSLWQCWGYWNIFVSVGPLGSTSYPRIRLSHTRHHHEKLFTEFSWTYHKRTSVLSCILLYRSVVFPYSRVRNRLHSRTLYDFILAKRTIYPCFEN
jgi:hypothetical protein